MSALNGSSLELTGAVELKIDWQESGPVYLPVVKAKAGEGPSLTIVDAELLLDTSVHISSVGSIRVQYSDG